MQRLGQVGLVLALGAAVLWSVAATQAGIVWRAGARLLADGRYRTAIRALDEAISLAPPGGGPGYDRARAVLTLSYAYLARRDPMRAGAVLPPDPTGTIWDNLITLQRGRVARVRGDLAAARAALAPLAGRPGAGPVHRAALWHLAEIAWAAGDPAAGPIFATLAALPAPAHDPYTLAAQVRLAMSTVRDDPAVARRALAAARAALPAGPSPLALPDLNLDPLGVSEGLPAPVISATIPRLEADLLGARALGLEDTPAHAAVLDLYWGRALLELDAWPQAAALLMRATADPTLGDAYGYLGLARERLGDSPAAEAAYRQALTVAPGRDLARHLLARLLIAEGRLAEAGPLIEAVLAASPDSVVAWLDRAAWARAAGRYDLAETALQTAEQQQVAHEQAGSASPAEHELNTSRLLAEFYFVAGSIHRDCELARGAARRGVARHPGAAEYDTLGWAHHLCLDDPAAHAALEQAVALDRHSAAARYHLGVVLKALGDPTARATLEAAADLDAGGLWERRAIASIVAP